MTVLRKMLASGLVSGVVTYAMIATIAQASSFFAPEEDTAPYMIAATEPVVPPSAPSRLVSTLRMTA